MDPTNARETPGLTAAPQVLAVFWYHKIALIAADQALLDTSQARFCARQHLHYIMSILRTEARIEEERMLLHVYLDTLPAVKDKIEALEGFLAASGGSDIQQALTHLDLASYYIDMDSDSQAHTQHLVQASRLFEASQHRHGQLDLALFWISRTESAPTTLEKIQQLRGIAARYVEQDYPLGAYRALTQAAQTVLRFPEDPELDTWFNEIDAQMMALLDANGAVLIRRTGYISAASRAIQHEGDSAPTLEALRLQVEEMESEPLPKLMGMMLNIMAACYESLGNNSKALECERESLRYHKLGKDYIAVSDATFTLAISMSRSASTNTPNTAEQLRESIELLEECVIRDEDAGYFEGASSKYQALALAELRRHQLLGIQGALQKFISWREKLAPVQNGWSQPFINQLPIDLMLAGDYTTAAEFLLDLLQYYTQSGGTTEQITSTEFKLSMCFFGIAEAAKREYGDAGSAVVLDKLPDGIETLERVFVHYENSNTVSMTVWCAVMLARARRNLSPSTSSEPKKAAIFRKSIEFLTRAESKCDELRQDIRVLGGLQALLDKRKVVSKEEQRSLYTEALGVCLAAGEISAAWVWVQKGKARGLADMLGSRYTLPLGLDQEALDLMAEERKLVEHMQTTKTPQQAIAGRRILKAHQTEMRKIPRLAQYLSAREGALDFISLDSIFDSLSSASIPAGKKIVLIDWVILADGEIAMITVDSRKKPQLHRLGTTITAVEKWLRAHFRFPEGEEPDLHQTGADRILAKLNGLVAALEECTDENDLLIFSPTGLLHQLPLHALRVGGRVLLDRNLIIYSSSLAILRNCLDRSETKITSPPRPTKSVFFGVYEEEEHFDERRSIFNCVKAEAEKAGAPSFLGPEVTRIRVLESMQDADWIHFHGHVRYDKQDILGQGLALSDGVDIFLNFEEDTEDEEDEDEDEDEETPSEYTEPEEEEEEDPHEDLFRIRDIFTLKLDAPHLTLIACESGVQQIEPGDEPLGIISAFLFAGAASAVGTLWPTLSPAGRAFADAFYENLRRQKHDKDHARVSVVVSLAVALREAVRGLRADSATSSPYCWAPFVLHGAWFCRAI